MHHLSHVLIEKFVCTSVASLENWVGRMNVFIERRGGSVSIRTLLDEMAISLKQVFEAQVKTQLINLMP